MEDIVVLLENLESTIRSGKKNMFGGRVVDDNACLSFIAKIREVLPTSIINASHIEKSRDVIIAEARKQEESIISQAREQARIILDTHEITLKARTDANDIVAKARDYADYLVDTTMQNIDGMLNNTENDVADILRVVRGCREDLRGEFVKNNQGMNNMPNKR